MSVSQLCSYDDTTDFSPRERRRDRQRRTEPPASQPRDRKVVVAVVSAGVKALNVLMHFLVARSFNVAKYSTCISRVHSGGSCTKLRSWVRISRRRMLYSKDPPRRNGYFNLNNFVAVAEF